MSNLIIIPTYNEIENIENIITGDFNIAPTKSDCYESKSWGEKILTSPEERKCFEKFLEIDYIDTFRYLNPKQIEFSWWDYRIPFKRNFIFF